MQNEPMAPIAGTLIKTKKQLEQSGLMDSKRFSGFGNKEDEEDDYQTIQSNDYASSQLKVTKKRKRSFNEVDSYLLLHSPLLLELL